MLQAGFSGEATVAAVSVLCELLGFCNSLKDVRMV